MLHPISLLSTKLVIHLQNLCNLTFPRILVTTDLKVLHAPSSISFSLLSNSPYFITCRICGPTKSMPSLIFSSKKSSSVPIYSFHEIVHKAQFKMQWCYKYVFRINQFIDTILDLLFIVTISYTAVPFTQDTTVFSIPQLQFKRKRDYF